MNRQQKQLLFAMVGMLALLLVLLLVVTLNRPTPDQSVEPPAPWTATDAPPTDATVLAETPEPVSEEELGRQAMTEEEGEDRPEDGEPLPVD